MSFYSYLSNTDDPTSELHLTVSPRLAIHPGNELYLGLQLNQMMLQLIQVAKDDLHSPRSQAIMRAAEKYFWKSIGHKSCPEFEADIPAWSVFRSTVSQPMEPSLLLEKIESLKLARPSSLSFAAKNFDLLASALNLSNREKKLCIWSYCHEQSRRLDRWGRSGGLGSSVLPNIGFDSDRDRASFFAKLFNEDENQMYRTFRSRRLASLRLLDTELVLSQERRKAPGSLHSVLSGTDHFINLIEVPQIDQASIVHQLLAPEFDDLISVSWDPLVHTGEMSSTFRSLYSHAQLNEPLDSWMLQAMVDWITGIELTVSSFYALDKKLLFDQARQAIKLSAARCCRARRRLTETEIFFALYEMVTTTGLRT